MVSTTIVMSHVKAGRLKAIGVVGPRRLAELPDVPTMGEQGAGDVEVRSVAAALWTQGPARSRSCNG